MQQFYGLAPIEQWLTTGNKLQPFVEVIETGMQDQVFLHVYSLVKQCRATAMASENQRRQISSLCAGSLSVVDPKTAFENKMTKLIDTSIDLGEFCPAVLIAWFVVLPPCDDQACGNGIPKNLFRGHYFSFWPVFYLAGSGSVVGLFKCFEV